MKDYSNYFTPIEDRIKHDAKLLFVQQLNSSLEGEDILLDGVPCRVMVRESSNPYNEFKEERKVFCLSEIGIHRGSLIEGIDSEEKFIVISDIDNNGVYKKAKMVKVNYELKWLDLEGELQVSPCILTSKTLYSTGEDVTRNFVLGEAKLSVIMPETSKTRKIKLDKRFIIDNEFAYKVTGLDRFSQKGIINLTFVQDVVSVENDDLVQGIADYKNNVATYSVIILNNNFSSITVGQSLQLSCEVRNNNTIIQLPELEYISSNENIATVDENGLVTGVTNGTVDIMVKFKNKSEVISLDVTSIAAHDYTCEIEGLDGIKVKATSEYKCVFKDNGTKFEDISNFTITADDGVSLTSLATIVSQDSVLNTCTIKANETKLGYVILHVTNSSGAIIQSKRIQIKSLLSR